MAAPAAPLQACVLVEYPSGFASSGNTPRIHAFARLSPADAATPGILMRVERCTGAGCAGFVSIGTGAIEYAATAFPQAEFSSTAVYNTTYRYRIRFENADGNGPYSAPIEISTLIHGTSACDTSSLADFQAEAFVYDGATILEVSQEELYVYDLTILLEVDGRALPESGGGGADPGPEPGGGGLIGEVDICSMV